jgi:hypothetical protein
MSSSLVFFEEGNVLKFFEVSSVLEKVSLVLTEVIEYNGPFLFISHRFISKKVAYRNA